MIALCSDDMGTPSVELRAGVLSQSSIMDIVVSHKTQIGKMDRPADLLLIPDFSVKY